MKEKRENKSGSWKSENFSDSSVGLAHVKTSKVKYISISAVVLEFPLSPKERANDRKWETDQWNIFLGAG